MRTALLAYSQLDSICLYLIALWQEEHTNWHNSRCGPPRAQTTADGTAWIRLLHVRKRNTGFEEQHKGRQISKLSLITSLAITGMVLSCSDSEILFYLRVMLSIWIPHTKITLEYYDWFKRRNRFVTWFNLSFVTNATGTRTSVSDILCGTQYYEFSV